MRVTGDPAGAAIPFALPLRSRWIRRRGKFVNANEPPLRLRYISPRVHRERGQRRDLYP